MIGMQLGTQQLYRLYLSIWQAIDWLFPPLCGGCNAPSSRWCQDCQYSTQTISIPFCRICGSPFTDSGICESCISRPPHYEFARSWALFEGPIRNALHRLKYRRDVAMGEQLSRPLIDVLQRSAWPIDLIAPIPLSKKRTRERGYNQVDFIARPIAMSMNIPYRSNAVCRHLETTSQVGLSIEQRRANVNGAFRADNSIVAGINILLIDDVITTGATMNSCAASLLSAGAQRVFALSVGRTVLNC